MPPTLNSQTASTLHAHIDNATSGPNPTLPGAIVQILDARGTELFTHTSHKHTPKTLFSIHSCSKLIGAIAFMQLVDAGLATLDDASLIEKWLPELAAKKVLTGVKDAADGTKEHVFEDRKGAITARMLLDHTNGTGNTFFNVELRDFLGEGAATENEGTAYYDTLLKSPLLYQPGTKTNYGQGLDWISVLVERLAGKSFEDVLREGVFDPLGITHGGFRGEMGGSVVSSTPGVDFWPASLRLGDGDGGFMSIPGFAEKKVERGDAWPAGKHHMQSVATGLVLSVADLGRIYSVLLPQNAGVDPVTGTRILSAASAAEFAKVVHPVEIRNDSRNIPAANPVFLPYELQAPNVDPAGCFGLGSAIQGDDRVLVDGRRGRSKGSVYWVGAANVAFWIDGAKGVVVVAAGNFFPFMDGKWLEFVEGLEGLLYEGIEG
ncbi:beta-lactamase/transpeptidase-like protein [Karstenula rhodostoma CBS 690.94]|uniref:Beta-lactamase/transpeptidase-like protein n=1 Tax=Karstenula rhodostoma CBS 690.94 TaxID=1392251 RepID=A0A9P4P4U5_9PLEO|nr:beta-lactamase/transpeptidase-like protein [Karstenula rhodostoma CBS 690.94]